MWTIFKLFMAVQVGLYRLTAGKIGGRFNNADILLLTTQGRKSGKKRTMPLMYVRDGDAFLVTASANGEPRNPGWYWNATRGSAPVQVQVGDKVMRVAVTEAGPEQRDQLYRRFIELGRQFAAYERKTTRKIPVLILRPQP